MTRRDGTPDSPSDPRKCGHGKFLYERCIPCEERTPSRSLPSAIYVWLVPSEEVQEQPGSWRIRKWDTAPFQEANYTLPNRTVGLVVRDGRVVDTCGSSTQVQDGFYFLSLQEQADDELTMRLDHPKKEWAARSERKPLYLIRAWEDTTDMRFGYSDEDVRVAYAEMCIGRDDDEAKAEIDDLMRDFADPDNWSQNGTKFNVPVGECAHFEVLHLGRL